MSRTFSASASCWLAASALASAALAGTPPKTCAAQECEIEDSSLLGIRKRGPSIRSNDPSPTPAPNVCLAGGHKQAGDADDVQVWWLLTELQLGREACKAVDKKLCPAIKRDSCLKVCEWMVGLHHVGIGFDNINTGHKSHAEFDANSFGPGMLYPEMDHPAKGNWSWKGREATTHFYEQWEKPQEHWNITTHVATIKGSDYNKIVSWICSGLKKKVTQYVLFTLATPAEAKPDVHHQREPGQVFPRGSKPGSRPPGSSTCMDAGALILQKIKEVAGSEAFVGNNISDVVKVKRNDIFQLMEPGTSVRKLDIYSNPEDNQTAYNYFSSIDKAVKKKFPSKAWAAIALISEFWLKAANGTQMVYTDINQDYWSFTPSMDVASYHESQVPAV